jgi:uncharacterized protein YqgQ
MIHHQPEQIITRGIIRKFGYIIPMEFMGDPQKMIQFIREEYTLRFQKEFDRQQKLAARPKEVVIDSSVEFRTRGTSHWDRYDKLPAKLKVPINVIDQAIYTKSLGPIIDWVANNSRAIQLGRYGSIGKVETGKKDMLGDETNSTSVSDVKFSEEDLIDKLIKQYETK